MTDKTRKRTSLTGPTYLTILRMVLSVVFMAFALQPELWARIVALVVFIIAAITDKIDGIWARNTKQVTDLGAFLDPLADKMLVDLAFLFLVYIYVVPIWVFAIIIVRDLAVDGMRMMVAKNGTVVSASIFGKAKTMVQMFTVIFILLNRTLNFEPLTIINIILLYIVVFLTVLSGMIYLIKGYQKLK